MARNTSTRGKSSTNKSIVKCRSVCLQKGRLSSVCNSYNLRKLSSGFLESLRRRFSPPARRGQQPFSGTEVPRRLKPNVAWFSCSTFAGHAAGQVLPFDLAKTSSGRPKIWLQNAVEDDGNK